jgi:hypothetical protein
LSLKRNKFYEAWISAESLPFASDHSSLERDFQSVIPACQRQASVIETSCFMFAGHHPDGTAGISCNLYYGIPGCAGMTQYLLIESEWSIFPQFFSLKSKKHENKIKEHENQ